MIKTTLSFFSKDGGLVGSPSFVYPKMSLHEPPQKLNQSELPWNLLSAFIAPILGNMKTVRMAAARQMLFLWKKARTKAKPG